MAYLIWSHVWDDYHKSSLGVDAPGFPIQSWMKDIFVGLANSLGKFIAFNKEMIHLVDKKMETIMIEFDVTLGLLMEVELIWGNMIFMQKLDYQNIPFRYHFCMETR